MLAQGAHVKFNIGELVCEGIVCGFVKDQPLFGVLYIIAVTSNELIPNETYPYTHIVLPNIYLTLIKEQERNSHERIEI